MPGKGVTRAGAALQVMCAVSYLKQLKNVFCFRLPLRRRQRSRSRSRPRLQTKPTEQSAYYAHMKGIIIRFGWLQ